VLGTRRPMSRPWADEAAPAARVCNRRDREPHWEHPTHSPWVRCQKAKASDLRVAEKRCCGKMQLKIVGVLWFVSVSSDPRRNQFMIQRREGEQATSEWTHLLLYSEYTMVFVSNPNFTTILFYHNHHKT
jgi:hypothetical protein